MKMNITMLVREEIDMGPINPEASTSVGQAIDVYIQDMLKGKAEIHDITISFDDADRAAMVPYKFGDQAEFGASSFVDQGYLDGKAPKMKRAR
jgi:hypothetical protein